MWQVPAVIVGALVAAAKAAAAKAAAAAAAAIAAAKAAGAVNVVVGAVTFLVIPIVVVELNYKTVEKRARASSPGKAVAVRREKEGDRIRVVLEVEASGEPAVWFTEKLDALLERLLPRDGATASI